MAWLRSHVGSKPGAWLCVHRQPIASKMPLSRAMAPAMSNSGSGFRSRKVGCAATRMLRANSGIAGVRYIVGSCVLQQLIYCPRLARKAGQVKGSVFAVVETCCRNCAEWGRVSGENVNYLYCCQGWVQLGHRNSKYSNSTRNGARLEFRVF